MFILQVLIVGISTGLVYGLISIGLSLIWGIMDMVNFAHADFMMLSMYFTYLAWKKFGLDPLVSLPFIIVIMFVIGVIVYRIIIVKTVRSEIVTQILCTFGIVIFLQNMAQFLWSANYQMIKNPTISGSFILGDLFLSKAQAIASIACIGTAWLIWYFIHRTKLGWAIQATAQNKEAAPLIGINVNKIFSIAWGIGLVSVGIAGVFLSNYYYIFPQVGTTFQLIALVVVALGGFGSITGAMVAGVIVGIIEALSGFYIDPAYKYAIVFFLYIVVVSFRPQGLFGTH